MRIEAYNQIQQIYNDSKIKKAESSTKAGQTDKVEISNMGKDIQTAKKALSATPDIRTDLTTRLKQQIQSGTYSVSGESFADKLLASYDELG